MRELLRRCWYLVRARRMADDLREELEFHRAMKERELEAEGVAPRDARVQARRALGNDLAERERARDVWIAPWLQDLAQDVRFAVRLLFRERGFATVAIVALGLGIGVNNTLFSILNAFCIRGLPIEAPDRVVFVGSRDAAGRDRPVSYADFQDLQASSRTVGEFAAFAAVPVALRDNRLAAERFQGAYVSASLFGVIREDPVLGRGFRPDDDRAGAPPAVVISGGAWKARYGGDPGIVGRPVVVNGTPATVVGVMREGFGFPGNTDVWLPLTLSRGLAGEPRDARTLAVIGRLAEGVALADARAEIAAIGQRIASQHRATNENIRLETVPINEHYMGRLTHPAWLAFITAGALVVLIACANVANLLLSRAVVRSREIAIRASLGATRRRVVRQLLVESAVLALCGGVLGFVLSLLGLELMLRAIPAAVRSYWLDFSMDATVFTALAGVCAATVMISGLVPAIHVSRTDASEVLRAGRGATGGVRARRWSAVFLTTEFALTMVLLSVVGETVVGFLERRKVDRAFDPAPLLTMMVSLPADKYPTAAQRIAFYETFAERLRAAGDVSGAAFATSLPIGGAPARDVQIDSGPSDLRHVSSVRSVSVTDDYFATLGVRLVAGRAFAQPDGTAGHERAIVNQRFAEIHFGGQHPLGRRIRFASSGVAQAAPWMTIVGVTPTVRQRALPEPDPVVYIPARAEPPATAALIVRVETAAASITPLVREELRRFDPDLPAYRILSMDQAIYESGWNGRVSAWTITILAAICVALSVVGLYAVTSHSVAQRTQELGVRVAIGARPRAIRWLVLRRALAQLAVGIAVGLVCVVAWSRLFGTAYFATPAGVVAVTALLVAVAVAACLVPAERAARLDPVLALRAE
jgi:putative ABC transport system permease protein